MEPFSGTNQAASVDQIPLRGFRVVDLKLQGSVTNAHQHVLRRLNLVAPEIKNIGPIIQDLPLDPGFHSRGFEATEDIWREFDIAALAVELQHVVLSECDRGVGE